MLTIKIPASTANLGPGFDCLGLALKLYLTLEVAETDRGISFELSGEGANQLPKDESNFLAQIIQKEAKVFDYPLCGLHLRVQNEIPLTRGLGSSAAAIIGALLTLNTLSHKNFSAEKILTLALNFEPHPDNLVPALLGGFTIATLEKGEPHFIQHPIQNPTQIILAIPDFEVSTEQARKVLSQKIALSDAVYNLGRSALLTGIFFTEQFPKLKVAMQDKIHQPAREPLIPGMRKVFAAAYENGAYGVALSGSGPTVVAFSPTEKEKKVGAAMEAAFQQAGVSCKIKITEVDNEGAKILH